MWLLRCLRGVGGVVCRKALLEVADDVGRLGDDARYRRMLLGFVDGLFETAVLVEQLLGRQRGACSKCRKEDGGHEFFHFCAFLRSREGERGVVISWRDINARK